MLVSFATEFDVWQLRIPYATSHKAKISFVLCYSDAFSGVIIALSIGSAAQGTTMTPVPPNSISSHVLDTAIGKPAAAVAIIAFKWNADRAKWIEIGTT